jgi:hypothetical protein
MPNITVYLPDELAERVKGAELNVSGVAQRALADELDRRDELAAARDGMTPLTVDAMDRDGTPRRLRFTGRRLADVPEAELYLSEAGKVLLVEEEDWTLWESTMDFAEWLGSDTRDAQGRDVERALEQAAAELGVPVVTWIDS